MFKKKATLQGTRERMTNTQLLMTISICIFVVLYAAAVFGIQGFDKPNMFFDLINGNAPIIIVACALTIVMIGGGIDISVGGVIMVSAMSCSRFLYDTGIEDQTVAVLAALMVSLGVGLAFGLLHGYLVSYLGIQPFIVTLAGMQLAKGVASMIYNDWMSYQKLLKVRNPNAKVTHAGWKLLQDIKIEIPWLGYEHPATGKWVSTKIEMGAMIAVVIVILVFLMLRYTKKGRHIYAVGGNQQSALMLGINVKRTRFFTYIMSGLLAGLAGFVYLIHSASADITSVGVRNEMDAIASSIIGGTLLTGGVGNVIGTFFGAMILISLKQIIKMAPWIKEAYWQEMISGAMLGFFIVLQSIVLASRGKFHPVRWIKGLMGGKSGSGSGAPDKPLS